MAMRFKWYAASVSGHSRLLVSAQETIYDTKHWLSGGKIY